VILTQRRAWKFPSSFLRGLLANLQETAFSELDWPELCPVVFALPLGLLVVMPRARLCPPAYLDDPRAFEPLLYPVHGQYAVPAEPKPSSFGLLDGRVVAVDYG
jgi:hypothetical protein